MQVRAIYMSGSFRNVIYVLYLVYLQYVHNLHVRYTGVHIPAAGILRSRSICAVEFPYVNPCGFTVINKRRYPQGAI